MSGVPHVSVGRMRFSRSTLSDGRQSASWRLLIQFKTEMAVPGSIEGATRAGSCGSHRAVPRRCVNRLSARMSGSTLRVAVWLLRT